MAGTEHKPFHGQIMCRLWDLVYIEKCAKEAADFIAEWIDT